jgi:2'-5' RNA ligase
MRMFVAIRPPHSVLEALADFLEPRREADSTLRWARPEQWHLTLAFMPSVADRQLDGLVERLAETASGASALELFLDGAGSFPNPAQAKVLWASVGGDVEGLQHLAGNVRSACSRAGTEVAGGQFRGHLTLARLSRQLDVTRWLRIFALYRSEPWLAEELVLYQSQLSKGPARHQVVGEFPLARR